MKIYVVLSGCGNSEKRYGLLLYAGIRNNLDNDDLKGNLSPIFLDDTQNSGVVYCVRKGGWERLKAFLLPN